MTMMLTLNQWPLSPLAALALRRLTEQSAAA